MRIFNKYKNTKGFISGYNHILKTKNINEEAKVRAKALSHWKKYGIESTKDAFLYLRQHCIDGDFLLLKVMVIYKC